MTIPISLDTVYAWLNRYEESYLRPGASQLVKRMEENIERGDFRTGWATLRELLKFIEPPSHTAEGTEILIICGWAAFQMRDEAEAIKMLRDAYPRALANKHQNAIARWMLGYILWLFPYPNMHEAIIAWEGSIDLFDNLARQRVLTSEKARWYRESCVEMVDSLKQTIEVGGIWLAISQGSGPRSTSTSPSPYSSDTSPRPTSPASYPPVGPAIKRHRIRSFPVLGQIPAGKPANIGERSGTMTFEDIILEDAYDNSYNGPSHYRIVSLKRGESIINISDGKEYYILKVYGSSMNEAQPEPITDGDYVLMCAQQVADHGDIVAVEIVGVDDRATLKRYSIEGGKPVFRPESNDPAFQTPIFFGSDDEFHIRGMALAVLKKLDD